MDRAPRALEIALQNIATYPELGAGRLRAWLGELVATVAPEAESLGVRFCGDRTMRRINREFRSEEGVTDVLSFPGERSAEGRHLGDVVLCVPQARRQAEWHGEPVEREVRRLLLHGVLHCLGYDHETDAGEMDRLERRLRRRWLATG